MSPLPLILIVDDDPDDIFILKRLLLKAGIKHKALAFEDPFPAMGYLESESLKRPTGLLPCMVFTDLDMSGVDGIQLVEWIRGRPVLSTLPVVMVSGSENPDSQTKALAAGATMFLPKYPLPNALRKLAAQFGCDGRSGQ